MSLIFDRRHEMQGKPAMHAFLTGISVYPHLPNGGGLPAPNAYGMKSLESPALTAFRLADWLIENKDRLVVPLASCRILASPSLKELEAAATPRDWSSDPTWDSFNKEVKRWKADAVANADSYTFFYFGGHGVRLTTGDGVLLMSDFGDGVGGSLHRGVRLRNIYDGMGPANGQPQIATKQFYFVDACRVTPKHFTKTEIQQVPDVWDVELGGKDNRAAPIFYGTISGESAYAVDGCLTVMGEALLSCLGGAAAEPSTTPGKEKYVITNFSLSETLQRTINEINARLDTDQLFTSDGVQRLVPLVSFDEAPSVEVTLMIDPTDALPWTVVEIVDAANNQNAINLPKPLVPHPITFPLLRRYYRLSAKVEPPQANLADFPAMITLARPPKDSWRVLMQHE